ncbi:STM4015 family protein [Nocardia sp. NPDC052566]|uniref:STM4015 family protein n=1 Tax=Nocardia sp. NPDC052566 TaxID=3364330 RepID=UPI0037CC78D9
MAIGEHLTEFCGLPAFDFPDAGEELSGLPAAESVAWRIGVESYDADEAWVDCFGRFLAAVDVKQVRALIVGCWNDVNETNSDAVIEALIAVKDQLPELRGLFLGDIVDAESEISRINQGLVTPLLEEFPALEEFGVRGGEELDFLELRHDRLRKLTAQTGGLHVEVVRGIAASDLPALTHLDLWLGTAEYGGNSEVADLAPILAGNRLPSLEHLALRNSEFQDAICAALASAPIVARLHTLDISMGVLTDDGAAALLDGQPLSHLKSLDMHHNYLSDGMRTRLREALELAGVQLNLDGGDATAGERDGTVERSVAVAE